MLCLLISFFLRFESSPTIIHTHAKVLNLRYAPFYIFALPTQPQQPPITLHYARTIAKINNTRRKRNNNTFPKRDMLQYNVLQVEFSLRVDVKHECTTHKFNYIKYIPTILPFTLHIQHSICMQNLPIRQT